MEDVPVVLSAEVARKRITFGELLQIKKGQTLVFDKIVGEPVDVMIVDSESVKHEMPTAYGEIVVINKRYGLRITAVARPETKDVR